MAAVAVTLLTRPPEADQQEVPTLEEVAPIDPNAFEIIADTDNLIRACNCSASSDNPYQ